ncbi:hypothetical protein [Paraburkholderia sp. RAU2J]|nr:hypothetical protein [Paraburkholderia sp. RAU2J]
MLELIHSQVLAALAIAAPNAAGHERFHVIDALGCPSFEQPQAVQ